MRSERPGRVTTRRRVAINHRSPLREPAETAGSPRWGIVVIACVEADLPCSPAWPRCRIGPRSPYGAFASCGREPRRDERASPSGRPPRGRGPLPGPSERRRPEPRGARAFDRGRLRTGRACPWTDSESSGGRSPVRENPRCRSRTTRPRTRPRPGPLAKRRWTASAYPGPPAPAPDARVRSAAGPRGSQAGRETAE